MSLQHLIDRDPILFAAILWIFMWLLVGAIISLISGWFSLAKVYRTGSAFDGAKWRMQSGRMRWFVGYNNVLTIGASQQGLYLASMFLFRFMHPPLLVPWSEIKVQKKKGLVFEYVTFPCVFAESWERICNRLPGALGRLKRRERNKLGGDGMRGPGPDFAPPTIAPGNFREPSSSNTMHS